MEMAGPFGSPQDAMKFLKKKFGSDEVKWEESAVATLSPEEQASWAANSARREAFMAEANRVVCELKCDRDRWWANVRDKYKLHGMGLHHNTETGTLHKIIEDEG